MTFDLSAQTLQAEKAVLGSMLMDTAAVDKALDALTPEDFYQGANRVIFTAMQEMVEAGSAVDALLVTDALRKQGTLGNVGGADYLLGCESEVSTADHVAHYARLVREAALERAIGRQLTTTNGDRSPENVSKLGELIAARDGLRTAKAFDFRQDLGAALIELFEHADPGVLTGFPVLDDLLCGLHPADGDLMTIGARTSGGKTATMCAMAVQMAGRGVECMYLTTEMSESQLVHRVLPMVSGIPAWKLRRRQLSDREKEQLVDAAKEKLEHLTLKVIGKSRPSLADIRSIVVANRPRVIFIDYLQRLKFDSREVRAYAISDLMRDLKSLAQQFSVQIVIGCQLDRARDKNPGLPPTLADLKDSAGIEAESDQVLLLWKPLEAELVKRPDWVPPPSGCVHVECLVAKNRHGPANVAADFMLNGELVQMIEREVKLAQGELQ